MKVYLIISLVQATLQYQLINYWKSYQKSDQLALFKKNTEKKNKCILYTQLKKRDSLTRLTNTRNGHRLYYFLKLYLPHCDQAIEYIWSVWPVSAATSWSVHKFQIFSNQSKAAVAIMSLATGLNLKVDEAC